MYGLDRLRRIYDKTEGYCYHCGKKSHGKTTESLNVEELGR